MNSIEDMVDEYDNMSDEEWLLSQLKIEQAEADFDYSDEERERFENRGQ